MESYFYSKSAEKSQQAAVSHSGFSYTSKLPGHLTTPSPGPALLSNSADGLTLLQLRQLRDAWQLEFTQHLHSKSAEKEGYDRINILEIELQSLKNKVRFCEPFEKLSDVLIGQCKTPFPILSKLSAIIAEIGFKNSHVINSPVSSTCLVKSGDSWLVSSSSSSNCDVLTLTPASASFTLTNIWKSTGFRLLQDAESTFPKELISYVYSGSINENLQFPHSTSYIVYRPPISQSTDEVDNHMHDRYCWIFSASKHAHESNTRAEVMESLLSLFVNNQLSGSTSLLDWRSLLKASAQSVMFALVELLQSRERLRYSLRDSLFRAAALSLPAEYVNRGEISEGEMQAHNKNRSTSFQNAFKRWSSVPTSFCRVVSKLLLQDGVKCDCEIYATTSQVISSISLQQAASLNRGDIAFPVVSTKRREITMLRVVDENPSALTSAFLTNKVVTRWLNSDSQPGKESDRASVVVAIPISGRSGTDNILGFEDDEEMDDLVDKYSHSDACCCVLFTFHAAQSRIDSLATYCLEHLISAVISVGNSLLLPWVSTHFDQIGNVFGVQLQLSLSKHAEIEKRPLDSVQASRTLNVLRYTNTVEDSSTAKLNTIIRELLYLSRKPRTLFTASLLIDHICNLLQSSWALIFIATTGLQNNSRDVPPDLSDHNDLSKKYFLSNQNFEDHLLHVVDNSGTLCRDELKVSDLSLECHDTIETLLFATMNCRKSNEAANPCPANIFNLRCASSSLQSTGYLPYLHLSDDVLSSIRGLTGSSSHVHHSCAIAIPVSIDSAYRDSFTRRYPGAVPTSTIIIAVGRFWKPYDKGFVDNCEESLSGLFHHAAVQMSLEESEWLQHFEKRQKVHLSWESEQTRALGKQLANASTCFHDNASGDTNLVTEMVGVLEVFLRELMQQRAEYNNVDRESTTSHSAISLVVSETFSVDLAANRENPGEIVREWVFDAHLQQFRILKPNSLPDVSIDPSGSLKQSPWRTDSRPISPIRISKKEISLDDIEITTRFAQQSLNLSQTAGMKGHHRDRFVPEDHGNIQSDQLVEIYSHHDFNSSRYFKMFVKILSLEESELLVAQDDDWVRVVESFIKSEQEYIFSPKLHTSPTSLNHVLSKLFSGMVPTIKASKLLSGIHDVPIFYPFLILPVGVDRELGYVDLSITIQSSTRTALPNRLSTCFNTIQRSSTESSIIDLPRMAPVVYNYLAEVRENRRSPKPFDEYDQPLELDNSVDSTSRVLMYTPRQKKAAENGDDSESLVHLVLILRKDVLTNPQLMTARGWKQLQQNLDLLFLPSEVKAFFEPSQQLSQSLARIHHAVIVDITTSQNSYLLPTDRLSIKTILEELSTVFKTDFQEGFAFLSMHRRGQGHDGGEDMLEDIIVSHIGVNNTTFDLDQPNNSSNTSQNRPTDSDPAIFKPEKKLHIEESNIFRWAVSSNCNCVLKRSKGESRTGLTLPQYSNDSNLVVLEIVLKIGDPNGFGDVKFLLYLEITDSDAWFERLNRTVRQSDAEYLPLSDWPLPLSITQATALHELLCYTSNAMVQLDHVEDIHRKSDSETKSSISNIFNKLEQIHFGLQGQCNASHPRINNSLSIDQPLHEPGLEEGMISTFTSILSLISTIGKDIEKISATQSAAASVIDVFEADTNQLRDEVKYRGKEYLELSSFIKQFILNVNYECDLITTAQASVSVSTEDDIENPREQAAASLLRVQLLSHLLKESIRILFCNGFGGDFIASLEKISASSLGGVMSKGLTLSNNLNDFALQFSNLYKAIDRDTETKCVVCVSWDNRQNSSAFPPEKRLTNSNSAVAVLNNEHQHIFRRSIPYDRRTARDQSHCIELECRMNKVGHLENNLILSALLSLVENVIKESSQYSRFLLLPDALSRDAKDQTRIFPTVLSFWDSMEEDTLQAVISSEFPLRHELMLKFIADVGKIAAISLRATAGLLSCAEFGDSIHNDNIYSGTVTANDGLHCSEVVLNTKVSVVGGECKLLQQLEQISVYYSNVSHFCSKKTKRKKNFSADGSHGAFLFTSPTLSIDFLPTNDVHSKHIVAVEIYRQPTLSDLQAFQDLISAVDHSCLKLQNSVQRYRQTTETHQIAASLAQTSVQLLAVKNSSRELRRLLEFQDHCANLVENMKNMVDPENSISNFVKLIENSIGNNSITDKQVGGLSLTVNCRSSAPHCCLLTISDLSINEYRAYYKATKHNPTPKWTVYNAEHFLGNGYFADTINTSSREQGDNFEDSKALYDRIVRNLSALSILSGSILLGRCMDAMHGQNPASHHHQCLNTSIFVPILSAGKKIDVPMEDGFFKGGEYRIDDPYSLLKEEPSKDSYDRSTFDAWVLQLIFPTVEDRSDYIGVLSDSKDFEDEAAEKGILQSFTNSLKIFVERMRERELQSMLNSYDKLNSLLKSNSDRLIAASLTRDSPLSTDFNSPEYSDGFKAANVVLARLRDSMPNNTSDDFDWILSAVHIHNLPNISTEEFDDLDANDLSYLQSSALRLANENSNSSPISASVLIIKPNRNPSAPRGTRTTNFRCIVLLPISLNTWSGVATLRLQFQGAQYFLHSHQIGHLFHLSGHQMGYLQQSIIHWMRVHAFQEEVRMQVQTSNRDRKQQDMLMELLCCSLRMCTEEGRKIEFILAQLQEMMILTFKSFFALEYLSITATLQVERTDENKLNINEEHNTDFSTLYSSTVGIPTEGMVPPQLTGKLELHTPTILAPAQYTLSSPQSALSSPYPSNPLSVGDLRAETPMVTVSPKTARKAQSLSFSRGFSSPQLEVFKLNQSSDHLEQLLKQLRSEVFTFDCYEVAVRFTFHFSAGRNDHLSPFSTDPILRSVFDSIGHSVARRVFELHRGARNKKALLAKQQEVVIRSLQLQRTAETIDDLEQTNSQTIEKVADMERSRLQLYTEITQLRAELSKKKETVHQLTLSQGDLKQSFHRTELQLKMQNTQQLDKVRHLETELAKLDKQLKKATVSKETILQKTFQMENLEKDIFSAREESRKLQSQLRAAKEEADSYAEKLRAASLECTDQVKQLKSRIRELEEEISAASGSNIFMREQLEALTNNIRSNERQNEQQRETIKQASDSISRLQAKLSAEKASNKELIISLDKMKAERDKLTTNWSIIRNEI
eukprot:gene22099-30334_t